VSPVLFKSEGLGRTGIHLGAATLDLGVPGLCDAHLRFTIQAPDQLEREPRTLLGGQS
jgi:hypothetical protein